MSTHNTLKHVLHYGSDSGKWTWIKTGKPAELYNKSGAIIIRIGKKTFSGAKLAVFYVTGAWPESSISFRNLDQHDLSYRNLVQHQRSKHDKAERRPDDKSGLVGVTWYKPARKWRARFQHENVDYQCGDFFKIQLAKMALDLRRAEVGAPPLD